jgi:hypothetical protein
MIREPLVRGCSPTVIWAPTALPIPVPTRMPARRLSQGQVRPGSEKVPYKLCIPSLYCKSCTRQALVLQDGRPLKAGARLRHLEQVASMDVGAVRCLFNGRILLVILFPRHMVGVTGSNFQDSWTCNEG